jgi:hypothetical protein
MAKDLQFKLIKDLVINDLRDDFLKVVKRYKDGQFNRNDDERYANGLWDLTASLGYDLRSARNENKYMLVYNTLWDIAIKIANDNTWSDELSKINLCWILQD